MLVLHVSYSAIMQLFGAEVSIFLDHVSLKLCRLSDSICPDYDFSLRSTNQCFLFLSHNLLQTPLFQISCGIFVEDETPSKKRRLRNGSAQFTLLKRWVTGEQANIEEEDINREMYELARKWMTDSKLRKFPMSQKILISPFGNSFWRVS
jgi:hypothetical protein